MSRVGQFVVAVLLVICYPRLTNAADLTLEWDPPTDGVTAGFVLFYGTASQSYSQQVNVGGATSYTVNGLSPGTTYYFAVRAYDASGAMSDPSGEVQATIAPSITPVVTALALTANVPSPQIVGSNITWFATAAGGVAPYQFQWKLYRAGFWTAWPWTAASTWVWIPSIPGDDYQVSVAVRSAGSSSSGELSQTVPFAVTGPTQTLMTIQVPASPSVNTGSTWELGSLLSSDVNGQITALRFWKSPSETGPHTGHLWTAAGQLLATVAFANETAWGWQQQPLGTPVAIVANTNYVVSVNTGPNGNFAVTLNTFAQPLTNGHLQAPAGNSGLYGSTGVFPTGGAPHNYFRDAVFIAGSNDVTSPTLSITLPAAGATVTGLVTIAAAAADDVGVAAVQFQVDGVALGSEQQVSPYRTVWDSTLAANGSHVVSALVHDAAGHYVSSSVTVMAVNATQPSQTLMTTLVPASPSVNTGPTWELGTRVVSDADGQVTALRFWKSPSETGPHTGHLWTAAGQLLATVAFSNETASGWQQQTLGTPVAIAANTDYVVSVNTGPNGDFAVTLNTFAQPLAYGHLQAPAGNSGLYGSTGAFPTGGAPHNYFRDVLFVPQ